MAHIFQRKGSNNWWIKYTDPKTREIKRETLNTVDRAHAELVLRKSESILAFSDPILERITLPEGLQPYATALPTPPPLATITIVSAPPRLHLKKKRWNLWKTSCVTSS